MNTKIKDEFELAEIDEQGEITLHPGDCFGWYSHVSADCHPGCCLRSEWCQSYTLNRANQSEKSMKKDLEDISQDSNNNISQKKVSKNVMANLGRQAIFDNSVNFIASKINHDNIKYNPNRTTASIKIGGKVLIFMSKKKSEIHIQIGGRGKEGLLMKMPMSENMEVNKSQICEFLDRNFKE